jgi:hypothetical protein
MQAYAAIVEAVWLLQVLLLLLLPLLGCLPVCSNDHGCML